MRVPSVGLSHDERRIIDDGYAFAERALRGYRDPPPLLVKMVTDWLVDCREAVRRYYRATLRG
jgi:hypothetical protein